LSSNGHAMLKPSALGGEILHFLRTSGYGLIGVDMCQISNACANNLRCLKLADALANAGCRKIIIILT